MAKAKVMTDDFATIADNLLAGVSGVRRVTAFDAKDHPSQIAGVVTETGPLVAPAGTSNVSCVSESTL